MDTELDTQTSKSIKSRLFAMLPSSKLPSLTQQSMQSLGQIRGQVNEVTNIMRQNIASVLDRGEALEDIVTRANDLQATTDVFHRQTTHINRQLYWKNMRMRICLIVMVLSIFAVIIIWASVKTAKDHTTTTQMPQLQRTLSS